MERISEEGRAGTAAHRAGGYAFGRNKRVHSGAGDEEQPAEVAPPSTRLAKYQRRQGAGAVVHEEAQTAEEAEAGDGKRFTSRPPGCALRAGQVERPLGYRCPIGAAQAGASPTSSQPA